MRKELDQALCEKYPLLYADRNAPKNRTAMCWGFTCGDGWYDLLDRLSKDLTTLIMAQPEDARAHFRAAQVKEKFGRLRFYMPTTEEMDARVDQAENESSVTCEHCGKPGRLRVYQGWYSTKCDEHAAAGAEIVSTEGP